jgi:tRNA(Ile)-lysidine synthase
MDVLAVLEGFFQRSPLTRGERLVVAFSGGGDSTALLWGLTRLAPGWGVGLVAAHLDHAMDAGSAARARRAAVLALRLGVPLVAARREIAGRRAAGESLEAAARRVRYQFLDEVRRACAAGRVATAHHRDDQAETVLLRLCFGSGLRGLQGIRPVAGRVVRPLLDLPRSALRQAVAAAGLVPSEDPGNLDPRQPRGRMRRWVLPALARAEPADPEPAHAELTASLARLAASAQRALPALDRRLAVEIGLADGDGGAGAVADRRRLEDLPSPLLPHALALLHRRAGAAFPPSRAAAGELRRQLLGQPVARKPMLGEPMQGKLASGEPVQGELGSGKPVHGGPAPARPTRRPPTCDCGAGWRWQASTEEISLRRAGQAVPPFTYTLEVPGELAIPEIAAILRVSRRPFAAWMLRGAPHWAALALPGGAAGRLTVRNRRPGDRLRPLGSPGSRKLKDVLIDRGVPRRQRDRLPLLCWAGEIAWVPGITIAHRFRLTEQRSVCLVEIIEVIGDHRDHPRSPLGNPGRESTVSESEGNPAPRG